MTYLLTRTLNIDANGDLILTSSPASSDNSTEVATTSFVQSQVAAIGYVPSNVAVTGGSINNTAIGNITASVGHFTTGTYSGAVIAATTTVAGVLTANGAIAENTRVVTAAGNVAVSATDTCIVMRKATGAATTITLPAAPATGRYLVFKDGKGDANNNLITISGGTIDGAASQKINTVYGSMAMIFDGSSWSIIP